jgi:hypothetical protein
MTRKQTASKAALDTVFNRNSSAVRLSLVGDTKSKRIPLCRNVAANAWRQSIKVQGSSQQPQPREIALGPARIARSQLAAGTFPRTLRSHPRHLVAFFDQQLERIYSNANKARAGAAKVMCWAALRDQVRRAGWVDGKRTYVEHLDANTPAPAGSSIR